MYSLFMILELSLASIFRPHNSYCLHIDRKAEDTFQRTVAQILSCYRGKVRGMVFVLNV